MRSPPPSEGCEDDLNPGAPGRREAVSLLSPAAASLGAGTRRSAASRARSSPCLLQGVQESCLLLQEVGKGPGGVKELVGNGKDAGPATMVLC